MTTSAFNALLLTLEEPPKHAIFIMATTNVENVPITILSRCQRFNFQKISLENLKKQIYFVCKEENITISEEAVEEIAYLSEGGMRDALSLLDQLSSTAEEITIDKILSHYGSISSKFIKELIQNMEGRNIESILNLFQELENTSSDYKVFLKKMVQEFTHISVSIKLNSYQGNLSFKQIKKIIFEFNDILNRANINMNPYILIKLVILDNLEDKIVKEEEKIKIKSDFLVKKEDLSHEEGTSVKEVINISNPTQNVKFLNQLKKVRINNCFLGAKKDILLNYQKIWKSLSDNLNIKPDIISFILDSTIVAASEDYCIISCNLTSTANLINTKLQQLKADLKEFFSSEINFIALSKEEWESEKQNYVKNLKSNYKYVFMNEPIEETSDVEEENVSELENVATNIFNRDKIEIV